MPGQKRATYGSWKSPITSDVISSGVVRFDSQIAVSGNDIYWIEGRPSEAGRYVIVRWRNGTCSDVTPRSFNARTRVHEYGGGAFLVDRDTVYFSDFADQRLYRQDPGGDPTPITPAGKLRFADGVIDRKRNRIVSVCEDHSLAESKPVNSIVTIDLKGGGIKNLVGGNDFYSSPRVSPDGTQIAWLTWNLPNMPWDFTELWLASVGSDGALQGASKIAGSAEDSICQPRFAPDGTLYFVSERTGWWNLYRWRDGAAEPITEMEAEFAAPAWVFGMSDYAFESNSRIVCAYSRSGRSFFAIIDTDTRQLHSLDLPYSSIDAVQAMPGHAVLLAASPTAPSSVVRIDLSSGKTEVVRRSAEVEIDAGYLASPEDIEFPTENGLIAHAFYYPPKNKDFAAAGDEKPPLLIFSHGGPTGSTSSGFSLSIQYWTSRGFAIADVNYGGSTGYGRAYRRRLDGKWGIVDVDDCVNCARHLIREGKADANRVAIRGGSAGGYTTLAALTFRNLFRAGASYFGVSDLEALEKDTHKFASRYLERLVGPYPDRRDLFIERSPIYHVDRLSCPVIFLQGDEDRVVPPSQAELMVEALRKKRLPVAYILFQGEQHGFRQVKNIKRALEAEFYFYSRIFGFEPADPIDPVQIENLA